MLIIKGIILRETIRYIKFHFFKFIVKFSFAYDIVLMSGFEV